MRHDNIAVGAYSGTLYAGSATAAEARRGAAIASPAREAPDPQRKRRDERKMTCRDRKRSSPPHDRDGLRFFILHVMSERDVI